MVALFAGGAPAVRCFAQADFTTTALLVATPDLRGSMFERSVVLVTRAPDANTIGLILNARSDAGSAADPERPQGANQLAGLYRGGPLATQSYFALAETSAVATGTVQLGGGIQLAAGSPASRSLFAAAGSGRSKLFRGYSGWAPGQLAQEVRGGAWIVQQADADVIFDAVPETLWERMTGKRRAVRNRPDKRTDAATA